MLIVGVSLLVSVRDCVRGVECRRVLATSSLEMGLGLGGHHGRFFGIALMPFTPQLITGYPLIAMVLLLLVRQSKVPETAHS